ncbi:zinc-dependent alcohol dehydrogenase family protein [Ramlibacter sp. AW1]|uniref:Zinc-dependent alcohol dehydrogenase family protein n=1 Tax=Ramlibacter aurantiacus TaxID=2801330 RepID=A0A937D5R1_9BURK|nr:zinc-dependent alcohol dehydrogenase family protein [Ramlibacter aurantiacus]MBL0419001.1 zinc-dependent alcohol dehydrogenase family protein [Ramlibacter aurantiacus]
MLAMAVDPQAHVLRPVRRQVPRPAAGEVLLRVLACGVCRTDLHILDGDLPPHRPGVIPGHEIVGTVVGRGPGAVRFTDGQRVGVPWLGRACGVCGFCGSGHENLCDAPAFTGYDRDGGYAEYVAADERFCLELPPGCDDAHAAPLLCAGLIGFRTWRLAGGAEPRHIGLWGFGAAAHIVCQLASAQGQQVYAFTRSGDSAGQAFARELGATWAGGSDEAPPRPLDASLIFAPVGALVPAALASVRKGGRVVCGGIHMSDLPSFRYELLWGERELRSVANLTREDGAAFFELLRRMPLRTHVQVFALEQAQAAVDAVRSGRVNGAAVLVPRGVRQPSPNAP